MEGHKRLYERLRAQDSEDVRHVFIVPDRYTLGVEKDLCDVCFDGGFARADVVSFTRFAVKTVGKRIKKCLTKEGTVILLDAVMRKISADLKYYRNLTGYGFAKEMFAAQASLRSGGITPTDLADRCGEAEGALSDKLSDIALIYSEYNKALSENYSDTVTRIDSLIEAIPNADLGRTHFYILGFNIYSEQQIRVIQTLLKHAASVSIPFVRQGEGACYDFQTEALASFCRDNGIAVERESSFAVVNPPFNRLCAALNGRSEALHLSKDEADRVRLFTEATPYDEVLAAAREIVYLTRKEGYRFKDIAVVCNDPSLLPIIRETFDRCEVPCFLDEGYPVADAVAVKYALYLLNAAENPSQSNVFKLSEHVFCRLSREEAEEFVRYSVKYNIRYQRFGEPFTLGECEAAEFVRGRVWELISSVPKAGTVADYCAFVKSALEGADKAEILTSFAKSADERVRASAVTDKFMYLTEEISALDGERCITAGEFASLLKSAISEMKTVLRPDYCDAVFVGSTEESRFSSVKALFVLGAADGFFPVTSGDGLIFSASDSEAMRKIGLELYPSPVEKNALERFIMRDLVTKPSEILYVGCAETDLGGDAQSPGDGFKDLSYYSGVEPKPLDKFRDFTDEERLNYLLVNIDNAYHAYVSGGIPEEYAEAVGDLLRQNGMKDYCPPDGEYPFERCFDRDDRGNFKTSVSQLECYFRCPFQHFLRYGLRVRDEEDSEIKASVIGNAVHNVLNEFFGRNLERVLRNEDTGDEAKRIIEREFARGEYAHFYNDPVSAHIISGVKKECVRIIAALGDNMRNSDFRPVEFETGFGYRKNDNEVLLEAGGRRFKLCGKIDRVDVRGDDVVIIDYKTGTVKPELKEIWCGEKIQLYVYLSYYVKKGRRAAGVFYQPLRSGNTSAGRSYACVGQMLDDVEIYEALDRRAIAAEGTYVSPAVAFKAERKEGTLKLNKSVNLFRREDFENAVGYTEKLMELGISEILEGFAEKKPLEGVCKTCSYRLMCGEVPYRKVAAVRAEAFAPEKEDDDV